VSKTGVGVLKDASGSFVHSDSTKAELLNKYFSPVFTIDNNSIPSINRRTSSEISNITFTSDMVYRKLSKLKTSTSADPDGLRASFLKKCCIFSCMPTIHVIYYFV